MHDHYSLFPKLHVASVWKIGCVFWEENLKRLNGNRYRLYAQTDICSRFTNCSNFWEGTFLKYLRMKVTLAPLKSLNLNHIKKIEWQHLRGTNLRWAFSLSTPKLGVRRALYSCEKLYFLRPANWRSPSSLNFGKEHFLRCCEECVLSIAISRSPHSLTLWCTHSDWRWVPWLHHCQVECLTTNRNRQPRRDVTFCALYAPLHMLGAPRARI